MIELSELTGISPFVRMMRLKKEASMSGTWRDIDNVFTYIASGSADFILDGQGYSLHTGNAIIIPPYMTHVIISRGTEPLIQYIMHFDFYEREERRNLVHKDVLDEGDKLLVLPEQECILGNQALMSEIPEEDRNRLILCYLNLLQEFQRDRPGRGLLLKAGCAELLVHAVRNCVDIKESRKDDRKKTKSWIHIENAIEYLLGCEMTEDLGNEQVAAAIGVSANYLTSTFQSCLGISLHRYVMNLKVEKAQQLLLSGRVNVTEAARLTGFSSIHTFSKTFKSLLGISPSEFLEQSVNREVIIENTGEYLNDMI